MNLLAPQWVTASCLVVLLLISTCQAFSPVVVRWPTRSPNPSIQELRSKGGDEDLKDSMSFDQAGAGLVDEDDQKKLADMGNYDENPDSTNANVDAIREALRARAQNLGIEKSKVTADYIERKAAAAQKAGSAAAAGETNDTFAGLDLSKIRQTQTVDPNDEDTPSMFYEVEDLISPEDAAEADPVGQLPLIEQAIAELKATKWPTPLAALKEVGIVIVLVALTGGLIIGWDLLIRTLYTDILHFIPTPEEMAEYTNRFDGLELPSGWTDNMNEEDIAKFSETVNMN